MPSSARRGGPTPCCCSTAAGAARRSRRRLISATRVGGWRKTDVADGTGGPAAARRRGQRELSVGGAGSAAEGLDRRDFAALDERCLGLYREGIRRRHREPLGADRHAASARVRTPEAGDDRTHPPESGGCEKLLHSLGPGEAVLFLEAVHPTNAARPVGGSSAGRGQPGDRADRLTAAPERTRRHRSRDRQDRDDRRRNRRRGLDDQAARNDRGIVSAARRDPRLSRQCALSPRSTRAGVAGSAREADQAAFRSGVRPHLNPIERLWGVMHKQLTHNTSYASYREFAEAVLDFLREHVPRTLARISSFGQRQLPRHRSEGFSGSDVNGV